jgi:hypothetical protein
MFGLVDKKSTSILKILSVTLFSDPTAYSGEYDPENSWYEKPSAILQMVPKAGYGRYKNQPIAVKQRRKSTKGREEKLEPKL